METEKNIIQQPEKKKFEYKWIILVLCILMNFVCLGFCSSNKGMYLTAITEALGIKRSVFSVNDSFRFAASAVVNLFFGVLIAKFGIRKMVAAGFVCTVASMLTYAFAENVLVFYLGGTLMGLGLAFTTTSMTGCIVRRWFHKDIGKYTGIVFASNGVGAALAAQICQPIIDTGVFGYRTSYLLVAGIVTVIGILVVLLLREKPEGEQPVAAAGKKKRGIAWKGLPFGEIRKKKYFYVAAATVLLFGVCLQGMNSAYMAHLKDVGMSSGFRAAVQSLFMLFLTATKLIVGWMYDRFGLPTVMAVCPMAAVIAFLVLTFVAGASMTAMILALVFCVLYALALPLETLVIPLIVNDLFGSVSYEKMLGIFSAVNYTGYALGSPIVNLTYDVFGSYNYALYVAAGVVLCGCIAFRFVLKEAAKLRQQQAISS